MRGAPLRCARGVDGAGAPSIARQVATRGAAVLVLSLLAAGVGTGVALHSQRVRALDQALLAAAHGRAHPDVVGQVEVQHSRSPVEVWLVRPHDRRVPREVVRQALRGRGPRAVDVADVRLLLLPFEVEDGGDDRHELAAAAAPRVRLSESVGPFALAYTLLSAAVAAAASLALARAVRHAFRPLERARDEASRVVGLGAGARLTTAGPVEVRALLEAMNDLLARLERAHQAQARFTAEAAHELRTPVAALLGELEVALRSPRSSAQYRDVLLSNREEVERLRQLVDGLTALARIDAGQAERAREVVRAGELAAAALAVEARALRLAGNASRLEVDADPELEVHRPLLEVALGNLLRNAARHAPGSQVVLRVGREAGRAVFDVDDAGAGVPPTEREALFDRFVRTGEARRRDRTGLGLGLPIAREVARRHGGDCVLLESPLGGLRARLTVPCDGAPPL